MVFFSIEFKSLLLIFTYCLCYYFISGIIYQINQVQAEVLQKKMIFMELIITIIQILILTF